MSDAEADDLYDSDEQTKVKSRFSWIQQLVLTYCQASKEKSERHCQGGHLVTSSDPPESGGTTIDAIVS